MREEVKRLAKGFSEKRQEKQLGPGSGGKAAYHAVMFIFVLDTLAFFREKSDLLFKDHPLPPHIRTDCSHLKQSDL